MPSKTKLIQKILSKERKKKHEMFERNGNPYEGPLSQEGGDCPLGVKDSLCTQNPRTNWVNLRTLPHSL